MANSRLSIQPVWGVSERKSSYGILDTAENLMENIDDLAEVLDKLTDKYDDVSVFVTISCKVLLTGQKFVIN